MMWHPFPLPSLPGSPPTFHHDTTTFFIFFLFCKLTTNPSSPNAKSFHSLSPQICTQSCKRKFSMSIELVYKIQQICFLFYLYLFVSFHSPNLNYFFIFQIWSSHLSKTSSPLVLHHHQILQYLLALGVNSSIFFVQIQDSFLDTNKFHRRKT